MQHYIWYLIAQSECEGIMKNISRRGLYMLHSEGGVFSRSYFFGGRWTFI